MAAEYRPPKDTEDTIHIESSGDQDFTDIWDQIQTKWPWIKMSELIITAESFKVWIDGFNEFENYEEFVVVRANLEAWQNRMKEESAPVETYPTIIVPLESADQRINYRRLYELAFEKWRDEDLSTIDFEVSRGSYPKDGKRNHYLCLHLIAS